jgi:hypothetical protein
VQAFRAAALAQISRVDASRSVTVESLEQEHAIMAQRLANAASEQEVTA